MRIPRIFDEKPNIAIGSQFELGEDGSGHVGRVLRKQPGDQLTVFNGTGWDFPSVITSVSKKAVAVKVLDQKKVENESKLKIHLGQVISRGDKMDFTIQKAVELGVAEITPLMSEFCGVRLDQKRLEKKTEQWRRIVISACEQCGRSVIPALHRPTTLDGFMASSDTLCLNLHPRAERSIAGLNRDLSSGVRLVIGSEGGLSPEEIEHLRQLGCQEVLLGPRVLRTETAALCAISILQCCYGDMA